MTTSAWVAFKSSAPICQQLQHMPTENLYKIAVVHTDQLHFEWLGTWKNKTSYYLILDVIVLAGYDFVGSQQYFATLIQVLVITDFANK